MNAYDDELDAKLRIASHAGQSKRRPDLDFYDRLGDERATWLVPQGRKRRIRQEPEEAPDQD